jgi:carboxylesterase
MNKFYVIILALLPFVFSQCKDPYITDDLLDGDIIYDASLYKPEEFLISAKYPNPNIIDLNKHIVLAVHGYSASTFEWQEYVDWAGNNKPYRISQVLLGGHGRTYTDFKNASWQDWKSAIIIEYEKLEELGYKKISLMGSSTGATLILELVSSGYFESHIPPKNIFCIDPIIVPSIKAQSIAGIIGPMLGYVESDLKNGQKNYWYKFRPHETVAELNYVMKLVQKRLESGITLPLETYMKVYHSKHDPTASSTSTVLIYKGTKTYQNNHIDVEIMNSEIHVFTRLALRDNISSIEYSNQSYAFNEIGKRLN